VLGLTQEPVDGVGELALLGERAGSIARPLEQVLVAPEPHEAQIRVARLPSAEELALSADLEVALGELEAVEIGRASCRERV